MWVVYAIVFFGTIARRTVSHIYAANWFFGGFSLAVALLHVVNSAAIPVTFLKSYSVYAGVQDAMVRMSTFEGPMMSIKKMRVLRIVGVASIRK